MTTQDTFKQIPYRPISFRRLVRYSVVANSYS